MHAVKSIFALFRKQKNITELLWVLTHPTQRLGVVSNSVKVVDRFSSIIGNPNEIVSDIQADHRNMTKFTQPDEPAFLSICNILDRWMNQLSNTHSGRESPYPPVAFLPSAFYSHEGTRNIEG